jgi:endonuclease/exonuclease/phosphatase family metal-dependent hydrolase
MSFLSPRRIAVAKMGRFLKLLSHDVVCAQEAHGTSADLTTLDAEAPNHTHWGSFHDNSSSGGVTISIKTEFLQQFNEITVHDLTAGRCLGLALRGPKSSLLVICLHLNPAASLPTKTALLKSIADLAASVPGRTLLAGDFNFLHSDECRLHVDDSGAHDTTEQAKISELFEEIFSEWSELHQPLPTRRQVHGQRITSYSRLDRIYTNLQPQEVSDRQPYTAVIGSAQHPNNISDHIPVGCRFGAGQCGPARIRAVPRWVTSHPSYAKNVSEILIIQQLDCRGLAAVGRLQEVLHEAARDVIAAGPSFGSDCTYEKLHWTIAALRAARSKNQRLLELAVKSYIRIAPWFSLAECRVTNEHDLHLHLGQLSSKSLDDQRTEMENDPTIAEFKKIGIRERLRRRSAAWAPTRKKASTFTVLQPDLVPAASSRAGGQLLIDHWSKVFSEQPCCPTAQASLLEHCVRGPFVATWVLEKPDFLHILHRAHDSAPGPDGLPYSAWNNAPQHIHDELYNMYTDMMDGSVLPSGFNRCFLACIPKGDAPGDHIGIARTPESTRPIAMSNSVAKLLAMAVNRVLAPVAQTTILDRQRGFVKGRSITDNIMETESLAIRFVKFYAAKSGIVLFDFAAAFPSLAHCWIFIVLLTMQFPTFLIDIIRKLYEDCMIELLYGTDSHQPFQALAGIKQGCPLSGTLFALALDPFIRLMCLTIPKHLGMVTAFADDIAIVALHLFQSLLALAPVFQVLRAASCLEVNPGKSVVIPLWDLGRFEARRWLLDCLPSWGAFKVQLWGRFLGYLIGPEAADERWTLSLDKYWQRGMTARTAGGGFFGNLLHYQIYGSSVLGYLLQLAEPPGQAFALERRILQYLTHGPWHAMPNEGLLALADLGFREEPRAIRDVSVAARYRTAEQSTVFDSCCRMLHDEPDDLEARLHPRVVPWAASSVVVALLDARSTVCRLPNPPALLPHFDLQSRTRAALRANRPRAWPAILRKRLERHFPPLDCLPLVQIVMANLIRANQLLKPSIVLASLRLICNGLLTSARFQEGLGPCKLCSAEEGDTVEHLIHCTAITIPFAAAIGSWNGPHFGPRRACLAAVLGDTMLSNACVLNDLTAHALAVVRFGPENLLLEEVLRARGRAIARHCRGASAVLLSGALRTPDRGPAASFVGPDLSDDLPPGDLWETLAPP